MIYILLALVGLCAITVVGMVVWLATFLNAGKFMALVLALGSSILAIAFFSLLIVLVANQNAGGDITALFGNPAHAWNITRAIFIPASFGSLIVGVTLYAGVRLYRRKERRLASLALLAASAVGLFLLFIVSGALLVVIIGG